MVEAIATLGGLALCKRGHVDFGRGLPVVASPAYLTVRKQIVRGVFTRGRRRMASLAIETHFQMRPVRERPVLRRQRQGEHEAEDRFHARASRK